ncbi:hypothetical protein WR164_01190 [Philodulcilactobacillus myokoensis]|uniref:DNA/RNA non-specific endonuclease/pyrophosphatase/phosphodiesterase domain-containing protein n=1 Tax=Philodulcilactobacillus myokoensis TaxID=2929573 RepID=A0A9W6B052_9LACO|nr:hypothetical protein WR164_01190 [Philodulcilactobacillus myokoensis]
MKFKKLIALGIIALSGGLLVGCQSSSDQSQSASMQNQQVKQTAKKKHVTKTDLAKLNYQSGNVAYVELNHNHSTLNPKDWKTNHVIYSDLDSLNRASSGNTAYLDRKNVANDSLRTTQYFQPTGWHQKFVNNEAIINRGHEIAYSLSKGISVNGKYEPDVQSGDQNNPKNLFTQTAFSNQKVQTIYESKVRNALRNGKKVIYQVQPIFRNDELMARGVHLQAISTDKTLNFNVYLFNVQPGIKFNYENGRSEIDRSMKVPTPAGAPTFNDRRESRTGRYYPHHRHHYVRDAVIAGAVHHAVKRHYERKYERRYYRHYYHHYDYHYHPYHHSYYHRHRF